MPHLALQLAAALTTTTASPGPWRVLEVSGGPAAPRNQVAIESNVRYLDQILPSTLPRRVLFADGSRRTASVAIQDARGGIRYRAPRLPRLDGPTTQAGLEGAWRGFVAERPLDPLLLFFTGHGKRNRFGDLDNNVFEMWAGDELSVRDLARRIETLPTETRVVLVMSQCYSGSFANLIFEGGRPDGPAVPRDLAGFFAATADRPATGCTPEVNEEVYRDFTGYFFAALSGRDRLGRAVEDADYDNDRTVGMDEAFAYALIHQETSDVPVSTSDVFLRRFVRQPDSETMKTPFTSVRAWASPAQRAALDGLSRTLRLRGEDRLAVAYDAQFGRTRHEDEDETLNARRLRFIRLAKSVVLGHVLAESGDAPLIARFEKLRASEARNPIRTGAFDPTAARLSAAAAAAWVAGGRGPFGG